VGAYLHTCGQPCMRFSTDTCNNAMRTAVRASKRRCGDMCTSSFSTAFLLSQRSACAKRNSEHELQKHVGAGNLDGGVLLRGEVNSSKYLAEGTCALGLKKMHRDCMLLVGS
jgi:hypothetical protein